MTMLNPTVPGLVHMLLALLYMQPLRHFPRLINPPLLIIRRQKQNL